MAWGLAAGLGRSFSFARVYDRVFEVLLAAAVVVFWRRLDLGGASELGLRRRAWARELATGLVAGCIGLAVALAVCGVAGGITPELRYPPGKTVRKALLGTGAALAIGVGEEALFRGVVLRRLSRDLGRGAGMVLTTAVYAAVHVIRTRGGDAPVHLWSGVTQTLAIFRPLADGTALPQLAGLALLGWLLAAARLQSGSLWLPIGIHTAFVAVFRVGRLFFAIRPGPAWLVGTGWPPLIGGAAGWIAVGVIALRVFGRRR
jgi:hypothetical protein